MSNSKDGHIYKAAGIIIRERKLLVARSKGKTVFVAPGGKLEPGETTKDALIRELMEECGIMVTEGDLEEFGNYDAPAAGRQELMLHMAVFKVTKYVGEPAPHSEIEELAWVNSKNQQNLPLGSIFEHSVTPELVRLGLID